jgi:hypothetical protein
MALCAPHPNNYPHNHYAGTTYPVAVIRQTQSIGLLPSYQLR